MVKRGSRFWEGIQRIMDKLKWGVTFKLGNGRYYSGKIFGLVTFPLRLEYPKLYECCYNTNSLVSDCWVEGSFLWSGGDKTMGGALTTTRPSEPV